MSKNEVKKLKNSFHLRLYNAEVVKSIGELMETHCFESTNELLGQAVGIGIEKIYLELGKRKVLTETRPLPELPEGKKIDRLERKIDSLKVLQEDVFILMNSVEALAASIYNVQKSQIAGEPLSAELLDSGYLTTLPDAYAAIKDGLEERFNRKLNKEKSE